MLDAGKYYLRPRQRIQIFDSDSDDDFQDMPKKSKADVKQRGDFNCKTNTYTKNESCGHESSGNERENAGTILRVKKNQSFYSDDFELTINYYNF